MISYRQKRAFRQVLLGILLIVSIVASLQYLFSKPINNCDNFNITYVQEQLSNLHQLDPCLIKYVRFHYLTPPSPEKYNLNGNGRLEKMQTQFSVWISKFFMNKRNGRFIEAGANSGEPGSHTLYLEKVLGWEGLLVEGNPTVVPYLRSKHRKAWIADICLSPTQYPKVFNFSNPANWTWSGSIGKPTKISVKARWTYFDVQAIPLYTILAALGWTEIDYFSLDIEGQELSVLKNFPFDKITFKVLIVEILYFSKEDKGELDELLTIVNDYIFVMDLQIDKIYVHKSVQHLLTF